MSDVTTTIPRETLGNDSDDKAREEARRKRREAAERALDQYLAAVAPGDQDARSRALVHLSVALAGRLAALHDPTEIAALFVSLGQMAVDDAFAEAGDPLTTALAYWQRNAVTLRR